MTFLLDYGLFLAKVATIVAAIVVVVLFSFGRKKQGSSRDSIEIKKLNKKFDEMAMVLNASMLDKSNFKRLHKQEKSKDKKAARKKDSQSESGEIKKRIFVLNFHGDIRASAVSSLREEITAILTVATESDEVFLKLESGGGTVNGYGLAASQLMRVRDKNIRLTVSVDKVAASGGYMMACVGHRIIAAPFAIIGSIGVIAQLPNFNKVLKKHDIDYEQFTAGEFKRTVTVFGENTDEAKAKFHEEIEDIHVLFKDFIVQHRPDIDIVKVATGESWPGTRALDNHLVDELKTSDDYLLDQRQSADIYEIHYVSKKPIMEKIGFQFQRVMDKLRYESLD